MTRGHYSHLDRQDKSDQESHKVEPKGWVATHLKTGNQYIVTGESIHAGNEPAVPGELMVEYQRDGKKYVRSAREFLGKFSAERGEK